MKKFLSALMAAAILLLFCMPATLAADSWTENTDISGADLKIGIIGDSHVTTDSSILGWFQEALSAQKAVGGGSLDGIALTGDVIYQNKSDELITDRYDSVITSLNDAGFGTGEGQAPYVYAMGNHEFPQNGSLSDEMVQAAKNLFVEKTGQTLNYHTVINGYDFIAAAPVNYNLSYSADTESWLKQEIDAAIAKDRNKPVFVLLHGPVQGTVFDITTKLYSDEFVEYLKTKPQVVNLTAHWHVAAQLPQNIWQDGYTVFESPLTGGGYLEELNCTSTGNISTVHQASMLTVKDNVVKIYKMDLVTKEFIGEPWVIDIPSIVSGDISAYLYSADKRENSNKPAFPADASVSATVSGNSVTVTYPNTATNEETANQQDGFIRAYKVEIVTASGTVITSATYQNEFYSATPSASFTRSLGGLPYGVNFVANVYPMSPLGVFGEPISTTFATAAEQLPENAVRYELEDYCTNTGLVKTSEFASAGKLVSSNQGGMLGDNTTAERTNNPSFSFKIDVPVDGTYKLEYAFGYHNGNTQYVSPIALSIDDTVVGTNDSSYDGDLSLAGQFPWSYIPLKHYTKSGISLTAGKHTAEVKVTLPTVTTQPYLFCADYIQLTPLTAVITTDKPCTIEFEEQASNFSVTPTVKTSANTSAGGYIHFDTPTRTEPVTFSIPVSVAEAGVYSFEYVSSQYSATEFYLDDAASAFFTTSGAGSTALDSKKVDGKYPYFNETWHQALRYTFSANLAAGSHTLNGKLLLRPAENSTNDVCLCMDYLKITYVPSESVVVNKDIATRIEFEDYTSNVSIAQNDGTTYFPEIWTSAGCSNGKYMGIDSTDKQATNEYETFTIPITVQQEGYYNIQYAEARGISPLDIYLDSTDSTRLNSGLTYTEDATRNEAGKYAYFESGWAVARIHSGKVYLPAGEHKLVFRLQQRASIGDFAAYLDYIEFELAADEIKVDGSTATALVNYDEAQTGKAILALYNGKELVGMQTLDVTNQNAVTISMSYSGTVTDAKMFVWNDLNNCIPQTETKILTIQ